ncbi:MAG: HlyD family efflux transporter periplasmic adaptor subunit [Lachnospiraceae bacterium]|nr:HlyD family efflux transporter periplasmic adaptor subunit [Lachnospiraceae bacterium]
MKKTQNEKTKKLKSKKPKRILAFTVALVLVVATVGGAISKKNKSKAEETKVMNVTVEKGSLKESVSGTGTISYADTTDIEVMSDLEIISVLVSEGDTVSEGDLLATVDESSLAVCIAEVEDEISSVDSTITSELSSSTTKYIKAGVSGTVLEIYGKEGDDVADVMVEHGAVMTVQNGDETIKVVGSEGTISSVNVSEGSTVSASTKVMTLDSDSQSSDYVSAVKEREELVSILDTLLSIKKNGGITATVSGMVESVNTSESETTVSQADAATVASDDDNATEVAEASSENVNQDVAESDNTSENDTEIESNVLYTIKQDTTAYLTSGSVSSSGTTVGEGDASSETPSVTGSEQTSGESSAPAAPSTTIDSSTTTDGATTTTQASTDATASTETTTEAAKQTTTETTTDTSFDPTKASSDKSSDKSTSNSQMPSVSMGGSTPSVGSSQSATVSTATTTSTSSAISTKVAFTIANGDKMKVTMNVDELDIMTMQVGLSAEITLDAVTGKTFTGEITFVSATASSSNGSSQYPVEITFDKSDEMLSGMNASVEVIINEVNDVLTIPLVAVTDEGRSSYVYTEYNESTGELSGKTEVTLGMSDESSVEVTEGLSEGDTIYYEVQSDSSNDKSSKGGMNMPGDMSMPSEMPSFDFNGNPPSGGNFPSGGPSGDFKSKSN